MSGASTRPDPSREAGFDVAAYLEVGFPAELRSACVGRTQTGVMQVLVSDRPGSNVAYHLGPDGVRVRKGVEDAPNLTLAFVASDLEDFVAGRLDARRAMATRRLEVFGDLTLLERLASNGVSRLASAHRVGRAAL